MGGREGSDFEVEEGVFEAGHGGGYVRESGCAGRRGRWVTAALVGHEADALILSLIHLILLTYS